MKKMGYIIGLVIGIPLFILIANFFFFRGNYPSETEIVNYIKNSDVDTIILPQNVQMRSEQYIIGFSRRGRPSGFLDKYPFYDKKFNKHFLYFTFIKLIPLNKQDRGELEIPLEIRSLK